MKKRKTEEHRELKQDEKVLWNLVTRTVTPISSNRHIPSIEESFESEMETLFPAVKKSAPKKKPDLHGQRQVITHPAPPAPKAKVTKIADPVASHIDRPVYRKIAKGRLPIDSQIDLHDMTQDQAIIRLQSFLKQAQAMNYRHILVITGKGGSPTSEGVLRRMLPIWLNTPAFSSIVNGYQAASRGHGGDGAFYVRLRRLR